MDKKLLIIVISSALLSIVNVHAQKSSLKNFKKTNKYEVAVYYFPQWHVDPQNEKKYGYPWTEWEVLKNAKPRFEGHQQPKVPLWGYEDD